MRRQVIVIVCILFFSLTLVPGSGLSSQVACAQGPQPGTPTPVVKTPYFSSTTHQLPNGESVDEYIINGPPTPPPGTERERAAVVLPRPDVKAGTKTLVAPAFNWVFGCSSVSAAMIAGYYDRNGYPNMYAGPTNGGVMPLDNSSWPTWSDGYTTYPNLPLAASHQGVDGRATRGSIDDYWIQYLSAAQDPYLTGSWTQHTWSDAIGDYMKTSQSAYSNVDGSTAFTTWAYLPTPLTCSDMVNYGLHTRDGTYGRKLFYEARGYTVTDCYNQKTDNNGGGFTFALYKAEIDAGRPVMLNLAGHTVVGVGYDDSTNTVYLHDTWDYNNHAMTWGGSYSNMALRSVSIVNLQSTPTCYTLTKSVNPSGGGTVGASPSPDCNNGTQYTSGTVVTLTATPAGGYSFAGWSGALSGSTNPTTITMNATRNVTANFTPGAFDKTAPVNGATQISASPTLNWAAVAGAASYEYCYDTTNNSACDGTWTSTTNTNATLNGLGSGVTYYWQVRARNGAGTTNANGGTWWSFTTIPNTFLPLLQARALPTQCEEILVKPYIWDGYMVAGCDSTVVKSGMVSLRIEAVDYSIVEMLSNLIPVQGGQTYQVSYWVKTDLQVDRADLYGIVIPAQYNASAQDEDDFRTNRLDPGFSFGQSVGGQTDWVLKSYTFTTLGTSAFVRLRGVMGGPNGYAKGRMWLDQVTLSKQ